MSWPITYLIQPAWRASYRDGRTPVRDGWNLVAEYASGRTEWLQWYRTRAEALVGKKWNEDHQNEED